MQVELYSCLTEELLASQGLCSTNLVGSCVGSFVR